MAAKQDYRIDREHLHEVAGVPLEWVEAEAILARLKGKEVRMYIYNKNFERFDVRAVIKGTAEEAPGYENLWVEDWKGHPYNKPWAIQILETYPLYE